MRCILLAIALILGTLTPAMAQTLQDILQTHNAEVAKPSRKSISVVLDDLVASGLPQVPAFLEQYAGRNIWQDVDGTFFIVTAEGDTLTLQDVDSGAETTGPKSDFTQIKPNGGVRRVIGTALVQFQLMDPDLTRRQSAIDSIARRPEAAQLAPLLASIEGEADAGLKARKVQTLTTHNWWRRSWRRPARPPP